MANLERNVGYFSCIFQIFAEFQPKSVCNIVLKVAETKAVDGEGRRDAYFNKKYTWFTFSIYFWYIDND